MSAKPVLQGDIRVFLVDDHPVVRAGVRSYLSNHSIDVVGEASDAKEALRKVRKLAPDVIILDVNLPYIEGGELARRLRHLIPKARLIAFSIHSSEEYVVKMARCGVQGYVTKDQPAGDLLAAITVGLVILVLIGGWLTDKFGAKKVLYAATIITSVGMALMFGTAGLPHILMRFFTVPNAKEARKSVAWATTWIGYFYILTFIIGFGAITNLIPNPLDYFVDGEIAKGLKGGGNMAAIHLSNAVGGNVFLGFISASTSSITDTGALSPGRMPSLMILV